MKEITLFQLEEKCPMKQVIRISGKAKQVFPYIKLMAEQRPSMTIGELVEKI